MFNKLKIGALYSFAVIGVIATISKLQKVDVKMEVHTPGKTDK